MIEHTTEENQVIANTIEQEFKIQDMAISKLEHDNKKLKSFVEEIFKIIEKVEGHAESLKEDHKRCSEQYHEHLRPLLDMVGKGEDEFSNLNFYNFMVSSHMSTMNYHAQMMEFKVKEVNHEYQKLQHVLSEGYGNL